MSDRPRNRIHGRRERYWAHAAKSVENRTPVTKGDLFEAYDLLYQPGRIPTPSEVGEEAIDVQYRRSKGVGRESRVPTRWADGAYRPPPERHRLT